MSEPLKASPGVCDWCHAETVERVWKGAYNICAACASTAMTPDEQAVERVARAIADAYNLRALEGDQSGVCEADREAARAAIAALAQPKVGDGEVQAMVERLRREYTRIPGTGSRLINPDGPAAADLLERLTSP